MDKRLSTNIRTNGKWGERIVNKKCTFICMSVISVILVSLIYGF